VAWDSWARTSLSPAAHAASTWALRSAAFSRSFASSFSLALSLQK
jgi:hypothetical protein